MSNKVEEKVLHCKNCKRNTLHYKNTKEMSWMMHLFLSIITLGIWIPIWFLLMVVHLLTKPIGGNFTCSSCGK